MDRLWSIDEIYEQVLESEGELLHYGYARDETPLVGVHFPHENAPKILITGASSGAELSTVPLAFSAAAWWRQQQWDVLLLPLLDPARGRYNEATLSMNLTPSDTLALLRRAWGPGETVDANLPTDAKGFWQPINADATAMADNWVPSSEESIGLWRIMNHYHADIHLSLREYLTGGASVGLNSEIDTVDGDSMLAAINDIIPLHHKIKLLKGRSLTSTNIVALPSLVEERDKFSDEDTLVGGISFWQATKDLALQVWLPRWTYPSSASDEPSTAVRNVLMQGEQRERGERVVPVQIQILQRPGHPADGKEIRVAEVRKTQTVQVGQLQDQPALSGWLAVEAWYERKDILRQANELLSKAREHGDRETYQRAAGVLRHADDSEERLLISYLQNKKYGRPATKCEEDHWAIVYPLETASMVAEVLQIVAEEDQRDRVIAECVQELQTLFSQCMPNQALEVCSIEQRSLWLERWSQWLIEAWKRNGFQRATAIAQLAQLQTMVARDKKALKDGHRVGWPKQKKTALSDTIAATEAQITSLEAFIKNPDNKPAVVQEPPSIPSDARIALSNAVYDCLETAGVNERLLERFAVAGVPVELLYELELDVISLLSPEEKIQFFGEPKEDISSPDETNERSTEETDTGQDDGGAPAETDDDITQSAQEEIVQTTDDTVQTTEDEPDTATAQEAPGEESTSNDEASGEERIAMTPVLRAKLEEEGLPAVIIDRLDREGIPVALANHLLGDDASVAEEAEEQPTVQAVESVEEDSQTNLDILLPPQLVLDPEWGRGPIQWDKQLPEVMERPFEEIVQRVLNDQTTQPPSDSLEDTDTLTVTEPPPGDVVILQESVFHRRRVELRSPERHISKKLVAPEQTGGRFSHRIRSL